MINADYDLLSVTTDEGEKYSFNDKEKMYKFLRETIKEFVKENKVRCNKPFIFKGITK
jgi:hypothetical protein